MKHLQNFSGQRFGKLVVLKRIKNDKHGHSVYECSCDCGNNIVARGCHLKNGAVISCKCDRRLRLDGKKFGHLVVVKLVRVKDGQTYWQCLCDCGNITELTGSTLNKKHTQSCGCRGKGWRGISGSYWCSIRNGANSRNLQLKISIQYAWEIFCKQGGLCALSGRSIGFGKHQTASLDRINSSLGYIRGNIQWVDKDINLMKLDLNEQDFISLCKDIVNWHKRGEW